MFIASWLPGNAEFGKIDLVRTEVFERERGIRLDPAEDARETAARLLVSLEDGSPVAAAKMVLRKDALEVGEIAVRKPYRDQGYEDLCLRMLLYKARQMPYDQINAYAEEAELPLYLKFGFSTTGTPVQRHGRTVWQLTVNREGIILASECRH